MTTLEEYHSIEIKCDRCNRIMAYAHEPFQEIVDIICAGCNIYHGKEEKK